MGDAAMAKLDEMAHGVIGACDIVRAHPRSHWFLLVVDRDYWHTC